jgi:5-methylcytosine-specific restriction endonuclease McrA
MGKVAESKRVADVARMMMRRTKKPFLKGIGIYAQVIDLALEITGQKSYSGHPKHFIRDNLEKLEASVKAIPIAKQSRAKKPSLVKAINGVSVASVDFLNTYEWRVVRMQALKKYGPVCMCCGDSPKNGAVMNVDHIKPRKLFPELALDLTNLQILCSPCNHGKGNWDQTDWRGLKHPSVHQSG